MSPIKNETGKKFGSLFVVKMSDKRYGRGLVYECLCDCGTMCLVPGVHLRCGQKTHCGCLTSAIRIKNNTTHGMSKTRVYKIWCEMIARCENTNNDRYHDYGGRGITVCERWRSKFENFYEDMGEPPTTEHSIDRYPDNNGNYEPGNCRWATRKEQCRNRRSNVHLTIEGETKILVEWLELTGMDRRVVEARLKSGWTHYEAIYVPVGIPRSHYWKQRESVNQCASGVHPHHTD